MTSAQLDSPPASAVRSYLKELGRRLMCSTLSHRRQVQALLEFDDRMLADIGLTRTTVREATTVRSVDRIADPRPGPTVRAATPDDIPAIQAIYARHVSEGVASFEEVPPSREEMAARMAAVHGHGLPYLAAELDGRVIGYSYASPYHRRPAYRHTLEDSVYVDPEAVGRGAGRALLGRLLVQCSQGPWHQMIAMIGDSGNRASIGLHEAFGFRRIGTLTDVGFKFGRWLDTVIMQKSLDDSAR